MTRHTRYAFGLLLVVLVAALGLAGIGPAQAQQGQSTPTPGAANPNQQGQAGTGFAVQSGDTLGGILGRFNLTEDQVRQFLVANTNLRLNAGQTVTFPAGITVTGGAASGGNTAGQAGSTATPNSTATGGAAGGTGQATGTPGATATNGANAGQATAAPGAGTTGSAGGQTTGQTAFNCVAGNANPGQTYVTQDNDTLGTVLTMMGLNDQGGQTGQVGTNQVVEFVYLNCDLSFDTSQAQTVVVPVGIPQTGAGQQAGQTGQQATPQGQATPQAQQGTQQGQQGQTYTVQAGDTLQSIANRFGVTLEALVAANPNLLQAGQTINIPAQQGGQTGQGTQQGAIPQTGQQAQQGQGGFNSRLCPPNVDPHNLRFLGIYVVRGGDNLTRIARRFNTTVSDLLERNPHVQDPNTIYTNQWIVVHPGEQVIINPPNWQNTCSNEVQSSTPSR